MASMASNIQKIISHRIPMIRFKYGGNRTGVTQHTSLEHKIEQPSHKTTGAISESKVSQQGAPLEFSQTPKKYRRRPLTQAEIDLVTIGGFS